MDNKNGRKNMKIRIMTLVGIVGLSLAGCIIPSVNPLYTEKELLFDPALVGAWGKPDEADRWEFARAGDKSYQLTVREKDGQCEFRAHLLTLGDHRFLDILLVRTEGEWKGAGAARIAMIIRPAHLFFKVQLTNSTLRLQALQPEWLDEILKNQSKELAHERLKEPDNNDKDGRLLLTASTAELQRFILKYSDEPKAFTEGDAMPKIEGAPTKPPAP